MAFKTMLRQLISKWGIMSIDLQTAFENDMSFKDDTGKVHYTEENPDVIDITPEPEMQEQPEPEPTQQPQSDVQAALFGDNF